jgi:cell division septation protein DedD
MLQVASFKIRQAAVDLLGDLSAEGYTGTVQVADLGERGTWHRVMVGPYKSEKEAGDVLESLRQKRNLKGYIVR